MLSLKNTKLHPVLAGGGDGRSSRNDCFADVTIKGGGAGVEAISHRFLLAAASPLLSSVLPDLGHYCCSGSSAVVMLPDTDHQTITNLVVFLRSEEINCDDENAYWSLLELMQLLQIDYVNRCTLVSDDGAVEEQLDEYNGQLDAYGGYDTAEYSSAEFIYPENAPFIQEPAAKQRQSSNSSNNISVRSVLQSSTIHAADSRRNINVKLESYADANSNENNRSVPSSDSTSTDDVAELMHSCPSCSKCFSSSEYLRRHIKRSHSQGIFACSQCNYSTNQKGNLNVHVRRVHEGAKNYACPTCDNRFSSKQAVEFHVRSKHLNLKPFQCDLCDQAFSLRQALQQHMRSHTGEKPFCCGKCGKTFKSSDQLTAHDLSHLRV